MKKCPYCAELIQNEAIVCRFCGRDLIHPKQKNRKSKKWWIVIGIIFGLLFLIVCCILYVVTGGILSTQNGVEYKVSGGADSANIIYWNEQGDRVQIKGDLPWSKKIGSGMSDSLYVAAETDLYASSKIRYEIWKDDKLLKQANGKRSVSCYFKIGN